MPHTSHHTPTLVIIAAVPFHGIVARPQHIARLLAERGWNVLYIDGPVTWLSPLKDKSTRSRVIPANPTHPVPVHGDGKLTVLTPMAMFPFSNQYRFLNRWNQRLLSRQIQTAAPGPYVLLSMLPASADLLPVLHPVVTLYDCVDFHSEFQGFVDATLVDQMEMDLAHSSRVVFATADALKERMESGHPDVRLVPNAGETAHFASTAHAPLHPKLATIPEPRIGFIGGIGSWIDTEFITGLAKNRPEVQFVMIGPVETDISQLDALPNVHFLGKQPYAELPQFLSGFCATLVPFRQNPLAQAVNPVKVYEFIAADKEVIGTPIREMKKLSDYAWIAGDVSQGVSAIDRILAGETKTTSEARAWFAQENSWIARVDAIEEALQSALPQQYA
jgi:glycosyltransferase involved in cell wall biosynthesis